VALHFLLGKLRYYDYTKETCIDDKIPTEKQQHCSDDFSRYSASIITTKEVTTIMIFINIAFRYTGR
jgi:hypothetical protein